MQVYKKRGSFNSKILIMVIILVILAGLAGVGAYVIQTYTIQTVYVDGNVHYTKEEIQELVMEGPLGNNSLYLSMKYKNKGMENIPFVDIMDVSILSPDTIRITVYEKALAGYVKFLNTYMYFDKDGYVVESSSIRTAGIPQITGLTFDYVILGEPLPVGDEEVFDRILDITMLLNKYELTADRIYFHKLREVTIYFGDVKVALGDEANTLEDKIMLLPDFLLNLEGRSGTLQMETYNSGNGQYTFKPDE